MTSDNYSKNKPCACGRGKQSTLNWTVCETRGRKSLVYCKNCQKKFWTLANTDFLPSTRWGKPLSWEEILALLREDIIRVDTDLAIVSKRRKYGNHWSNKYQPLKTDTDTKGYVFVWIYYNNRRKHCPVHRLVWMSYFNQVVPDEYDIHHRDADVSNNSIKNLEAIPESINRARDPSIYDEDF